MEELIRFRSQIDLLNDQEFIVLIESLTRPHVTNVLFEHFRSQLINTTEHEQWQHKVLPNIRTISGHIQKIIDSRDSKPSVDTEEQNTITNLDDLPMVMISSVSSFLNLEDTIRFERTNRTIFIGTRSPISLKSLDAIAFTNCIRYSNNHSCLYNFYRFRYIQQLTIDADVIDLCENPWRIITNSNLSVLPIWNRLTTLSLINQGEFMQNRHRFRSTIMDNLDPCEVELTNIHTVKWQGGDRDTDIPMDMFPSIRYLHLDYDVHQRPAPRLHGFDFSQLRGLSIGNRDIVNYETVVHEACGALESFHLKHKRGPFNVFGEQNQFDCLKELCLVFINKGFESMDALHVENFSNLHRIHCNMSNELKPNDDFKTLMEALLSVRSLNYLSVRCGYDMLSMMFQMIQSALIGQSKESVKIKIDCRDDLLSGDEARIEVIQRNILDLVSTLDKISNHFMLICYIPSICDILSDKSNLDESDKYLLLTNECYKMYISNKECNMNGYDEKWIMDCFHCCS
eukprot:434426_1